MNERTERKEKERGGQETEDERDREKEKEKICYYVILIYAMIICYANMLYKIISL